MTNLPRISVVLPTYNRRHSLLRALDSVLGQSLQADEIIVVDDGSTDGTTDCLLVDYPQVKVLQQGNLGVSHARNRGIEHATGDWVAFIDSDDEWLPEKLRYQVEYIQDYPDTVLLHSDEIWIRNGTRVNPMQKHQKAGGWIFQRCLPLCVISPSATLIRKSLFQECGLFDESLPACEDYDMWLRICSRYEVSYLDIPLIIKYGGHADQLSQRYWGMDRFRVRALSKIIESGTLKGHDLDATIAMLLEKCRILMAGAKKRNNLTMYNFYHKVAEKYHASTWKLTSESVAVNDIDLKLKLVKR